MENIELKNLPIPGVETAEQYAAKELGLFNITMETVNIYHDNILKRTIKSENAQNQAFGWLLRNQGRSTDYAIKHGDWKVEVIDEAGNVEFWKPYSK